MIGSVLFFFKLSNGSSIDKSLSIEPVWFRWLSGIIDDGLRGITGGLSDRDVWTTGLLACLNGVGRDCFGGSAGLE